MMQRRAFVRNFLISAAALAAGPGLRAVAARSRAAVGKEGWSGPAFAELQGSTFRVRGPEGTQEFVLDHVVHRRQGKVEMASLRFLGTVKDRLADGIYSFRHPDLRQMQLFISRRSVVGDECVYRVTMGRLV